MQTMALIFETTACENGSFTVCVLCDSLKCSDLCCSLMLDDCALYDMEIDDCGKNVLCASKIVGFLDNKSDRDRALIRCIFALVRAAAKRCYSHLALQLVLIAFKNVSDQADRRVFLIKFLTMLFKTCDRRIDFKTCSKCQADVFPIDYAGFNPVDYTYECLKCASGSTFKLHSKTVAEWRMIDGTDFSRLDTIKIGDSSKDYMLFLLNEAVAAHFGWVTELEKLVAKNI